MFLNFLAESYDFSSQKTEFEKKSLPSHSVLRITQNRDGQNCFVTIKEEYRQEMGLRPVDPFCGEPEEGFSALGSMADLRHANPDIFGADAAFLQFTQRVEERSIPLGRVTYRDTEIIIPTDVIEEISEEGDSSCFVLIKEDHRRSHGLDTKYEMVGYRVKCSRAELQKKNPGHSFPSRPKDVGQEIIPFADTAP